MPHIFSAGDPTRTLPCAYGGPALKGLLRRIDDDFVVEEDLGYEAGGEGEHAFLVVRKRGRNTHEVARALARLAGVAQVAVGYAGLKDRHAVTTQHFSVHLPGRPDPDWHALEDDGLQFLAVARHHRKIRRGSLRGNRFRIRVVLPDGDREQTEMRLSKIEAGGVPNYFGAQRFGHSGQNLVRVDELFAGRGRRPGREQRGLLLSSARAHLFNLVLADRVAAGHWNQTLDGDVMVLAGSQRQFAFDTRDETLKPRLAQLDVHPTGPLCGRDSRALLPETEALVLEQRVLAPWADWIDGLGRFGLDADRRALRLVVDELDWAWDDNALDLRFRLVAGAFATAVLRELVDESESTAPVLAG